MDDNNNEPLGGFVFSPAQVRRINRQRTWRRWRRLFTQYTDPAWLWENGFPIPALLWIGLAVAVWATALCVFWCITPA